MENLKKQRKIIKTNLTKLGTKVDELVANTATSVEIVNVYLERVEEISSTFNDIETKIELLTNDDILDEEMNYRHNFEQQYFSIKAKLQAFLNNQRCVSNPQNNVSSDVSTTLNLLAQGQAQLAQILQGMSSSSNFQHSTPNSDAPAESQSVTKLPTIDVPKFSGNYKDWKPFFDMYQSVIHSNNSLSIIQKFQYLKQALQGEAASTLKHLQLTEANYSAAYELLKKKYDKEDIIIESHLQTLHEFPPIKTSSAQGIRQLSNVFEETVRALSGLGLPTEHWDSWINYLLVSKLDKDSQQLWRRETAAVQKPSLDSLLQFLDKRVYELSSIAKLTTPGPSHNTRSKSVHVASVVECLKCSGKHSLYTCPVFLKLSNVERQEFATKTGLCWNCLKAKHLLNDCRSSSRCKTCGYKHHTLLHGATYHRNKDKQSPSEASVTVHSCSSSDMSSSYTSVLPTAIIYIRDITQQLNPCKALLDTGSQVTLISEHCVQRLKLPRQNARISITGVGEYSTNKTSTRGKLDLSVCLKDGTKAIDTTAFILSRLTNDLPSVQITKHIRDLIDSKFNMADSSFHLQTKVDVILGCDVVFDILLGNKKFISNTGLMLYETVFGWVVIGKSFDESVSCFHTAVSTDIDNTLRQFWEMEEIKTELPFSPEEEKAEQHFRETHERLNNGQYMVKLPFKTSTANLGDSTDQALKRLYGMEKRFTKDNNLSKHYMAFMEEYSSLSHMTKLKNMNSSQNDIYYLPHHGVWRQSSSSTKLRVVFDGSCKSSTGSSLNDLLHTGPKLHNDLVDILIRFRIGSIAYVADIEKMFRQILVHPSDRRFQLIFWRKSADYAVQTYSLNTVTYGTSCAPYLAIRTLIQLSEDEKTSHPRGHNLLKDNFYVDDLMASDDNLEEAQLNMEDIIQILNKATFSLHKWASNSDDLLSNIPQHLREKETLFSASKEEIVKTLGLNWYSREDNLSFKVNVPVIRDFTKRRVLSVISRIFDPLGLLSPSTILAKIFIQKLWIAEVDWDDPIPTDLDKLWDNYYQQLSALSRVRIPRWYYTKRTCNVQLHGFSDASEMAYAAVVYLRVCHEGQYKMSLIMAKTKVCPLKQITIARLELCAAVLLAKLIHQVKSALNWDPDKLEIYAWTDSTTVLAWLNDFPRRWSSFVGNRTSTILSLVSYDKWHHINSKNNPADVASRGIYPDEFLHCELWWQGPSFLHESTSNFQATTTTFFTDEEKRKECLTTVIEKSSDYHILNFIMEKFSSLTVILRVTAWCLRYIKQCYNKANDVHFEIPDHLSVSELNSALLLHVKYTQQITFKDEIIQISQNRKLTRSGRLYSLDPFIDNQGVVRVGGRLSHATFLANDQRHPIILHKNDRLSILLVEQYHLKLLHGTGRLLESNLRLKYWIIGAKYLIRKVTRSCVKCTRYKAETCAQKMASLPPSRFCIGKPFLNTGVDYAGPLIIRSWKGRGAKQFKSYIALYVCMSTKALHLEAVSDLSTESFLASFKRFLARRGEVRNMYSDNGTNFHGALRHLKEAYQYFKDSSKTDIIHKYLVDNEINWNFIAPSAPHHGGLWEAGVKRVKFHLKRIIGNSHITFEELNTVLCQIEYCLNSRPLIPLTTDKDDHLVLTPNHFLTGGPAMQIPEIPINPDSSYYRTCWQRIQKLKLEFWQLWQKDYLTTLQQKYKWVNKQRNLQLNDLVIVMEPNLPPGVWLLGRISEIHPGSDKLVRVVTVKTSRGYLKRPVTKLILLFDDETD